MSQLQPPSPFVGQYPIESPSGDMHPPVCLKTHWDPTEMIRHILPHQRVSLPQDFRPFVRVCKQYVTSGPAEMAPMPPSHMVFPTGGQFYPPGRYSSRIDTESELRTLTQPLDKWCPTSQYIPEEESNMYVAGSTVPHRKPISNAFIEELAMPQALLRKDERTCRSENDTRYFERSGRLFNNPTKQDRYGADKFYSLPDAHHGKGEPIAHGGVPVPKTMTEQARNGQRPVFAQPGGSAPLQGNRMLGTGSSSTRSHTAVVGVATSGLSAPVW